MGECSFYALILCSQLTFVKLRFRFELQIGLQTKMMCRYLCSIPELFDVWANEGLEDPIIEERLDGVERTKLSLSFIDKATKKRLLPKRRLKRRLFLPIWHLENGIVVLI